MIFYANDEQKRLAEAYIAQLDASGVFGKKKIATQVVPLKGFYKAEDYHQDYAPEKPEQPVYRGLRPSEDRSAETRISGFVCGL